jgi:hemerythrin-like domain-containing protein
MCEYCGWQALTAIDELTREHDLVVNLIGDVRAAHATADVPAMARLVAVLRVLRDHILTEQDGVFPAAMSTLGAADWDAIDAVRGRIGAVGAGRTTEQDRRTGVPARERSRS